jgi:prepilin-type N-terminal cleavage/methylation domain-containing protein
MMRLPFHHRGASARHGFTLAELLAVIVIMAIMVAVVVPNISGITKGATMRGATMQVRTALIQARQNAISRRAEVSVLLPTALPSDNPKNFRAFAVYGAATASTGSWFVSNWEFLPPGMVFKLNNLSSMDKATAPYDGTTSASMTALSFNRLGERKGASASAAQIWLMEGFVSGGTVQGKPKSGGTNQIEVLYPTGIIQVKRL